MTAAVKRRGMIRPITALPAATSPTGGAFEVEIAGQFYQIPAAKVAGAGSWNQTALQAPYDFANQFADLKGKANTETGAVAIVADAHVPSGFSAAFTGAGGRIQYPSSPDFDFGSANFTIEGWFRTSSVQQFTALLTRDQGSTEEWTLLVNIDSASDGKIAFYELALGQVVKSTGGYNDGNRHHVAVVRSGVQFFLFVDGVHVGNTQFNSVNIFALSTSGLQLGNSQTASRALVGNLDNWRITKGDALYTVAFTPPTPPFPTA
jgi:hypothetical protein